MGDPERGSAGDCGGSTASGSEGSAPVRSRRRWSAGDKVRIVRESLGPGEQVDRRFERIERQFQEIREKFAEIDRRFEQVAESFREVRRQLARLAEDHNGPARELSELRGEIRGRLDERARPASAPAG